MDGDQKMSQKVVDIVTGISKAVGVGRWDGATDEDGEKLKIGLKREEGNPNFDKRTMDGWDAKVNGKTLVVSYHSELFLRDVYANKKGKLGTCARKERRNSDRFNQPMERTIKGGRARLYQFFKWQTHIDKWGRRVRPWALAAWVFLTAGIALGSWCAYFELGWGGWWFWDPVENASFMPWLATTALLHS